MEGIRAETDSLGEIVTNFLNFARPTEAAPAPVEMKAVVERAADDVSRKCEADGRNFRAGESSRACSATRSCCARRSSNLFRNALEACVEAGITPRITVEVPLDPVHNHFRLTLSDNGPGIDPSLGDRIFRPFFTRAASAWVLPLFRRSSSRQRAHYGRLEPERRRRLSGDPSARYSSVLSCGIPPADFPIPRRIGSGRLLISAINRNPVRDVARDFGPFIAGFVVRTGLDRGLLYPALCEKRANEMVSP